MGPDHDSGAEIAGIGCCGARYQHRLSGRFTRCLVRLRVNERCVASQGAVTQRLTRPV